MIHRRLMQKVSAAIVFLLYMLGEIQRKYNTNAPMCGKIKAQLI
jgi:hypothetical protein